MEAASFFVLLEIALLPKPRDALRVTKQKRYSVQQESAPKNYNPNSSISCSSVSTAVESVSTFRGVQQSTFMDKLSGRSNGSLETCKSLSS